MTGSPIRTTTSTTPRGSAELTSTIELVAGAGITAVFTFAYILAAGRILGAADYADFSAAMSMFYFVAVVTSPLSPTLARIAARNIARGRPELVAPLEHALRRRLLRWAAFAAIPVAIAIVPLAHVFHFASPLPLALTLCSAAVFTLVNVRRGVLQGEGLFRAQMLNALFESFIRLFLATGLLLWLRTPAAALTGYLIAVALAELFLRRRFPGATAETPVDWSGVKQLVMPMIVAMLAVAVFQNVDMLAVKRWFTAIEAGQYGAASTLTRSISVLFVPIYTMLGPLLTHAHERGESLVRPTLRFCGYFLVLASMPATLFAVAANKLVVLLYGPTFAGAGPMLMRLSFVAILIYVALLLAQALITVGDRRFGVLYIGFAIVQVVAIVLARHSIDSIISSLYVVQGALVVAMFMALMTLPDRRAA